MTITYDEQQELSNMSIDELIAQLEEDVTECDEYGQNLIDLSYLGVSLDDM